MSARKVLAITCYNYRAYIGEALTAALAQTVAFDTIYVIDDGSTDGSLDIINRFADENKNITVVLKENGGQLSCFNRLARLIGKDDLVWLLDADDVYPVDYVETVLSVWTPERDGVVFCAYATFTDGQKRLDSCRMSSAPPIRIPASRYLTRLMRCWLGNPTSCMALTGKEYSRIFPYEAEADWRTRADDVIVYASSLLGSAKLYIPAVAIGYRLHGQNNFSGRVLSAEAVSRHDTARLALFQHYDDPQGNKSIRARIFSYWRYHQERSDIAPELFQRFEVYSTLGLIARRILPMSLRRAIQSARRRA